MWECPYFNIMTMVIALTVSIAIASRISFLALLCSCLASFCSLFNASDGKTKQKDRQWPSTAAPLVGRDQCKLTRFHQIFSSLFDWLYIFFQNNKYPKFFLDSGCRIFFFLSLRIGTPLQREVQRLTGRPPTSRRAKKKTMGNGVFSENGKAIDKSDAPLVCAMSFFVMRNSFINSVSSFFQRTNTNY